MIIIAAIMPKYILRGLRNTPVDRSRGLRTPQLSKHRQKRDKMSSIVVICSLSFFLFSVIDCNKSVIPTAVSECQHLSTDGRDYRGMINTTTSGIPCRKWSSPENYYKFTHLGDHNYCRNPKGEEGGLWCYTTDPDIEWENCSIPFCPDLSVLDLSKEKAHASLELEDFPSSFSICLPLGCSTGENT